jgi:thiamine-monophosphate kinase
MMLRPWWGGKHRNTAMPSAGDTLYDACMPQREFERIERLKSWFGPTIAPDVGIGDDAAVLHPDGPVVVTVDAAVEEVHFRRDLISWSDVSARAIEAAVSDIAAMGASLRGVGCGLLLAWTLPHDFDDASFDALCEGAQRAAKRVGAVIVGGNLTRAAAVTLTTTAIGRARGVPLTRAGARIGDVVALSGPVGAAAIGLRALLLGRGEEQVFAPFVHRWRHPHARLDVGKTLVAKAHAVIDLSDGLVQDAAHVARASGCAIHVTARAIPRLDDHERVAALLGEDARTLLLNGGEDYELLATGPREAFDESWTLVGSVEAGEGVYSDDEPTRRLDGPECGWDHFSAR